MRWGVFAIFVLMGTVLDTSLLPVLKLEIMGDVVRPSSLALIALFTCLWAPRMAAMWAAFIIGLIVDAASPWGAAPLFGPHALGFLFAAVLTLQLRAMVLRRELFAIGFLTMVFSLAAGVVVVAVLLIRSAIHGPEIAEWSASRELVIRLLSAIHSGITAVPLAWLLLKTLPFWGFHASPGVRIPRR